MAVLAVDVGGTKVAVATVDAGGAVLRRAESTTPFTDDAERLFSVVADLVAAVSAVDDDHDVVAVGVGCGGPMTRDGDFVSPLNIPAWRGFPLRARMRALTKLPVWVDNDAKALALGEGWTGAAAGERNYIGMVVSTGIGGGVVLDGRLLEGAGGNAGHIGHVIVEPGGRVCGCGARGCVEAEASGTAIAQITGRPPAEAKLEVRERTGTLVGRAIASVANLLDVPLAVVSGSVALGFGEPFFTAAQQEIDASCRLEFSRGTRVVPGSLGRDGPLVGAARVALQHL
jgi:glucokinase